MFSGGCLKWLVGFAQGGISSLGAIRPCPTSRDQEEIDQEGESGRRVRRTSGEIRSRELEKRATAQNTCVAGDFLPNYAGRPVRFIKFRTSSVCGHGTVKAQLQQVLAAVYHAELRVDAITCLWRPLGQVLIREPAQPSPGSSYSLDWDEALRRGRTSALEKTNAALICVVLASATGLAVEHSAFHVTGQF